MGGVLCEHCTAECCHYVALPIDEPETKKDFDDMRWYLMHEGVLIFVEEGDWYLQFRAVCRNLQPDFRCGVYETRPQICRDYKAGECDYTVGDYVYDHLFTDPEHIVEFANKKFTPKKKRAKRRKPKPGKRTVAKNQLTQLNVR